MRNLQALCKDDANSIVKKGSQEETVKENLNFLIDIAMVVGDTKLTKNEPQTFNNLQVIQIQSHQENGMRLFERSLGT